jgi:hypothetical protein
MRRTVGTPISEVHQIAKQGQHTDYDNDDAHDLLGPSFDRQHVDEIKDQNNDDEGNQRSDQDVHAKPRFALKNCQRLSV